LYAKDEPPAIAILPSVIEDWSSIEQNPVYGARDSARDGAFLKTLFEGSDSVPQILYSQFESVSETEPLPSFAVSRFDFVYKLRKLLEFSQGLARLGFSNGIEIKHRSLPRVPSKSAKLPEIAIECAVPIENGEFATVGSDGFFRLANRPVRDVSGLVSCPVRDGFAFSSSESHSLIFLRFGRQLFAFCMLCLPQLVVAAEGTDFLYLSPPSTVYRGRYFIFRRLPF
jgi:hypothetical protein